MRGVHIVPTIRKSICKVHFLGNLCNVEYVEKINNCVIPIYVDIL